MSPIELLLVIGVILFFGPVIVILCIIGSFNYGQFTLDLTQIKPVVRFLIAAIGLVAWAVVLISLNNLAIKFIEGSKTPVVTSSSLIPTDTLALGLIDTAVPTLITTPISKDTPTPFDTATLIPSPLPPTNTLTPTYTPPIPTLDFTLMTPSGGIGPVALVYEAESMGAFTDVPHREDAFGGRTVHLLTDDKIAFSVSIEQSGNYILYIRHSNSNLNQEGLIEILDININGIYHGKYYIADTGDGADGWEIFSELAFGDVFLNTGPNEIELVVTGGDGYGIDIDAIVLVRR